MAWFLWITLSPANSFAQSPNVLESSFKKYNEKIVHEKVFLHLDKANYLTGETLWLKVYCLEAGSHRPMDFSKVAYVEIRDRTGKPVMQSKISLDKGKGTGSIFLPATLDSDNYTLTAYTSWMKNFPKEYFFSQVISIVNPFRVLPTLEITGTKSPLDIQFFPEGGNLLSGVETVVAFRVVNANGKGVAFTGEIQDENQNTITTFLPARFGLGVFRFTPEAGKKYTSIITTTEGTKYQNSLPEIITQGYSLSVDSDSKDFTATISSKNISQPFVYLFAHAKNQTIYSEVVYLKNDVAHLSIPKDKFPDGISVLTVFDSQLNPVAERLVFKKPFSASILSIGTDAEGYSKRRKVKIKFDLTLPDGKIRNGDLSMSIFKKDSLSVFSHQDIGTYLLLSSELHGQIESPEYYLNEAGEAELTTLMLTHGWRRFSWTKILKSDYSYQWLPEIEGPILNGILYDETGKPAKNIGTYISTPSKDVQLYTSMSDANGKISYSLKDLFGPSRLYVQTKFSQDSLFEFKFESPFLSTSSSIKPPPPSFQKNTQRTLLSRSVSMQVQDVFNEPDHNLAAAGDTTPFFGRADETYFLDDYTRFPVMEEVMREYVKGVWVRKRQDEFYFLVVDNVNRSVFNDNPLILLDGVPVWRVNDIMNVNPLKVKKIDVLTRPFYHGKVFYPGIVSFTTYTNDLAGINMDRRNLVIDYDGLQQKRNFFTPVYETERQRSNRLPDQRNTLLWIPSLKLSGAKMEIECFTSDVAGSYEITVQGIDDNGTPISAHMTFTVSDYNN